MQYSDVDTLTLVNTLSVSTLSPIQEQDEALQYAEDSLENIHEDLEEHDIVGDEMFHRKPCVESATTVASRASKNLETDVEMLQASPTTDVRAQRKRKWLRIGVLAAALVPLWASWSTFAYFLVLATIRPVPRTPLTNSNAAITVALVCGLALPVVTAFLFLWTFSPVGVRAAIKTRRKDQGNCAVLWPYVLLFVGATIATVIPVAVSYAVVSGMK